MTLKTFVLERTLAYRLLQAPFAERKLAPVLAHNDLGAVRRVLDVACGPGTNTQHFAHSNYLGVDYNPSYVSYARRRHGRSFLVADVVTHAIPARGTFDFILANSFLHHVDTPGVARVLANLRDLLSGDGHVHILDLVMPDRFGPARVLARWDRGKFARRLDEWYALFSARFEPVVFEPYAVGLGGATLWSMVYFKGRARA